MKTIILKDFELTYKNKKIPAKVPGDINIDLFNAGIISNPYIAENYKESTWVGREDFEYTKDFVLDEETLSYESITITFKGIDLFASIYINDKHVGEAKNAFIGYRFNIKDFVKKGKNTLKVLMHSTIKYMESVDVEDYFAIFNIPRIFVRKPQCHFGWDWAPKICAYGIIDDVIIEAKSKYQIEEVQVVSDAKGNAIFHVRVNYINKDVKAPDESIVKKAEPFDNDTLAFYVAKKPFSKEYERTDIALMGNKNFFGSINKSAELWWPVGYGKQPLYNYKVELIRGGKVCDSYEGRFAYRSVELKEEPKDNAHVGFDFYINGVKIFLKGSNWVPPECFTGVMEDEKYRELISLARDMNANILRVWGGGAYEKDIFFDICDELGILVWQDIALACADIPEERADFMDNFKDEVIYQIKRLRNHPSLIYWCGGNEKTGSYGTCVTHGDFLVNVILQGLVDYYDGTRPYRRQSPHSFTDVGNESSSGDSHYGNFESGLTKEMSEYRSRLCQKIVPFVSECAVLAPSSKETLQKIFPSDKLWPMNEMWLDRFMDNPYCGFYFPFPQREFRYGENLHGTIKGLDDFIMKAMSAGAECLRAECEYSRAHREYTGAFLNWMFDDIWPSGTWSIVDYYLEPKQGYYALRKAFAPVLVSFFQENNGMTYLFVDNQTQDDFASDIEFGVKNYEGKILMNNKVNITVGKGETFKLAVTDNVNKDELYLFAYYKLNNEKKSVLYSPNLYHMIDTKNDFSYEIKEINNNNIDLIIKANSFVKSLFIHFKDNYLYKFSDNYLDLENSEIKTIHIFNKNKIDISSIKFEILNK